MDVQSCLVRCRFRRPWVAGVEEEQFTEVINLLAFHVGVNESV